MCLYTYIYIFTNLKTNACYQKNPVLPPSTYYEYQFYFHDMYLTLSNTFQSGEFQLLLMKFLFTWTHIYPQDEYVPL
jgi:hypothetical protein